MIRLNSLFDNTQTIDYFLLKAIYPIGWNYRVKIEDAVNEKTDPLRLVTHEIFQEFKRVK